MKTILTFALSVIITQLCFAQSEPSIIELTKSEYEKIANYAVWRTDYYICTGIAFAKSMSKSPNSFTHFAAQTHVQSFNPKQFNLKNGREKIESLVKTINFIITNYPGGKFEIVNDTKNSVRVKMNRAYRSYFKNGPILEVSLDEFENYLWGHIKIMFTELGVKFDYEIGTDEISASFTLIEK